VTFFNGGVEAEFKDEERHMVPSPAQGAFLP
jgi:bisphosphoglycerate-independent phosphoglycerate mutase (AlkP superfamily)